PLGGSASISYDQESAPMLFSYFLGAFLSLGAVSGTVTGSNGAPIADVQVSLPELRRSTTTDSSGRYTIAGVPAGTYSATFQRIGYAPAVRRIVSSGGDITVDVTLRETV